MNITATLMSLVLCALCSSFCFAQTYKCDWSVNGLGGGDMSSAAYRCGATAGQTAAGQMTSTPYWAHIGFWQYLADTVGVREEAHWPSQGSLVTRLYAPVPNPFRSQLAVRYSLASNGPAAIQVYDRIGRLVRSWAVSRQPSAVSSVIWDGRDSKGRMLANGVYFCRLVVFGLGHNPNSEDGIELCPAPALTEKLVLQR